jgi:hypothetical protein
MKKKIVGKNGKLKVDQKDDGEKFHIVVVVFCLKRRKMRKRIAIFHTLYEKIKLFFPLFTEESFLEVGTGQDNGKDISVRKSDINL